MVTFKLKKHESESKYWKLSLPAPYEGRTDDVLQKLKLDPNSKEKNCFVAGVESDLPLQYLTGQKINLHEAETLFQQLEKLSEAELSKFSAITSKHKPDIKNMIKISVNMHCFEVYRILDEPIKENQSFPLSFRTNADMILNKNAENNIRSFAVTQLSRVIWDIQNAFIPGLPEDKTEQVNSMKQALINEVEELRQNISSDGFGQEMMPKDNIVIDSELIIEDDHISAYLPVWFDVDERLDLNTKDTDEYINLYADYYTEDGRLDVYYIHRGSDGEQIDVKSLDMTAAEQELILKSMENAGLCKCIAEMSEEQESGMNMQ